jgi:hypothetical protein
MKISIHNLTAICAVALLSACGGGGNSTPPANTQSPPQAETPVTPPAAPAAQPLASAGVFVAAGQASATIGLSGCSTTGFPTRAPLNPSTASLRIDANGDLTFNYAGSNSPLIPAINQTIVSSTADNAELYVSASQGFTENFYDANLEDTDNTITLRYYPDGTGKYVQYNRSSTSINIECNIDPSVVISANMGNINARIAAVTSGVTAVSSSNTTTSFSSPTATWQNSNTDANVRAQLNITTGQVSVANQPGGVFTSLDIASLIAPSNGINQPGYSEQRGIGRNGPFSEISYGDNDLNSNNRFFFTVDSNSALIPRAQY